MSTVLTKDPFRKGEESDSSQPFQGIPLLGAPIEEKRFWFQRNKNYDPFAIATQVSLHQPSTISDDENADNTQSQAFLMILIPPRSTIHGLTGT